MPWNKHWSWSLSTWPTSSVQRWSGKYSLSPTILHLSTGQDLMRKHCRPCRAFWKLFNRPLLTNHKEKSRPPATKLVDLERKSTAGTARKRATSSDGALRRSRTRGGLRELVPLRRSLLLRGILTQRPSRETNSSWACGAKLSW